MQKVQEHSKWHHTCGEHQTHEIHPPAHAQLSEDPNCQHTPET